jgi:hypothetical protein
MPVTFFEPRDLYSQVTDSSWVHAMLLLTAILRVWQPREFEPNDLLAQTRLKVGHVSLTVIALVYVLVTFWQTA